MLITKDLLIKQIKDSQYPYWKISIKEGVNYIHLRSYQGDLDKKDETEIKTKIENSVKVLNTFFSDYPAGTIFSIELRNAKTANGAGIIGPLEVINSDEAPKEDKKQFAGFSGISGYEEFQQKYIPVNQVDEKLNSLKTSLMQEWKTQEQERRIKARERKVLEKEKELKEKEKEVSSDSIKLGDALIYALKGLAGMYFPALQGLTPASAPLSGDTEQTKPETSQKEIILEKMANDLNESGLSDDELEHLAGIVEKKKEELLNRKSSNDDIFKEQ